VAADSPGKGEVEGERSEGYGGNFSKETGNLGTVAKSRRALHFHLSLERAEIKAPHSQRTAFQGYECCISSAPIDFQ